MKIIISPAKKMMYEDTLDCKQLPVFLEKTEMLMRYLKGRSYEELKKLLCCNDEIATTNYERYLKMDLRRNLTPAILSYDGIQYKYMAPQVFEDSYFDYIEKNLRILSGFYGVLKPFDGIVPYRLEMQAKLKTDFCKNLYDFWGADIYEEVKDGLILNLASEEYAKTVRRYLEPDVEFTDCVFGEYENGRVREKGVYVKMARGEMVRFMAENNICDIDEIKAFNRLGFSYCDSLSEENKLVFLKEPKRKGE
ncbi:MAG: peroxide stress protein YaaA [Clostridiales bacterium]|nr:peroxide stress protein YaaA [Clostridiales bacterium]